MEKNISLLLARIIGDKIFTHVSLLGYFSLTLASLLINSGCSHIVKSSLPASSAIIGPTPMLVDAQFMRLRVNKITPYIQACYSINSDIITSLISKKNAPSQAVFEKSYLFSFSKNHELNAIIWIPNRAHHWTDLFSGVAHELTHIALTYQESLQLSRQIKKLNIHIPISFSETSEIEEPAYLVQYITQKKAAYLKYLPQLIPIYQRFGINLECLLNNRQKAQWRK